MNNETIKEDDSVSNSEDEQNGQTRIKFKEKVDQIGSGGIRSSRNSLKEEMDNIDEIDEIKELTMRTGLMTTATPQRKNVSKSMSFSK